MTTVDEYVPGDPEAIRSTSASIGRLGEDFGFAGGELRSVFDMCIPAGSALRSSSSWYGASALQFNQVIGGLPEDLQSMSTAHNTVSDALAQYAKQLAEWRNSAARAVENLNLKRAERDENSGAAEAARNRIRVLTTQLVAASTQERAAFSALQAARLVPGNPAVPQLQRSHLDAQTRARNISNERSTEEAAERRFRSAADAAATEVRGLENQLETWRGERRTAERLCAQRIRDALPSHLKNPSNFERARKWVGEQVGKVRKIGEAAWNLVNSGSFAEFVYNLRNLAKALSEILDLLVIVLVVAAIVVTVATGGAALPLAIGLLKGAKALSIATKGLKAAVVVCGIGLAASGAHINGRRAVTWGDVAFDGVSFGVSLVGGKSGGSISKKVDDIAGGMVKEGTEGTLKGSAAKGLKGRLKAVMSDDQLDLVIREGDSLSKELKDSVKSWTAESCSASANVAKRLFQRDFAGTVLVPHARIHVVKESMEKLYYDRQVEFLEEMQRIDVRQRSGEKVEN